MLKGLKIRNVRQLKTLSNERGSEAGSNTNSLAKNETKPKITPQILIGQAPIKKENLLKLWPKTTVNFQSPPTPVKQTQLFSST